MRPVLVALTACALAAVVPGRGTLAEAGHAAKRHAAAAKVTVTATDFRFKLSRKTIGAPGKVAFRVVNRGKIAHDFKIAGRKTKLLSPGKSQTITVTFRKKGRYTYLCTVPGHAKLGMKGIFAVGKSSGAATKVTVAASEFAFKLSRASIAAPGTVAFRVVNRGKIAHDFKIAGKKTKLLAPGTSETLTVRFSKPGRFAYLCTVTGHARLGMKGTFAVGSAAASTSTSTTTTSTTSTSVPGPATTVSVTMVDYRFDISQTTIPQGTVTFVITNKGNEVHNFDILGKHVGALLGVNGTEMWSVGLPAGTYTVVCDVPFHVDRGMTATLTITPS
jgi:uncharacterized cupredoxin-like copper-binding protein